MLTSPTRAQLLRGLFGVALATSCAGLARAADDLPTLYKIVSPRDEIVVGSTEADLAKFAARFRGAGQMEVWRYVVRKADSGDLVQAPGMRVMLIWSDMIRIEPYRSPLKIMPLT